MCQRSEELVTSIVGDVLAFYLPCYLLTVSIIMWDCRRKN